MSLRFDPFFLSVALSLCGFGVGCGDDAAADAEGGTSSATETTQPSGDTSGSSSTVGTEGTEDTGETDDTGGTGPTPEGYVNCGELSPDGPTIGPGDPGPLGFPEAACNPRADNSGTAYTCCSDDPAASGGGVPTYAGGDGVPIFAAANNELGTSGLCVRTDDLPAGSGLSDPAAANCPTPCNPTWDGGDIETVCGAGRSCCQTRQIQPEDCVQDEAGTWRPATGADILAGVSDWAPDRHATHQDPGGQGCATFAGTADVLNPDFTDCLQQLSVADQRGYCLALAPGLGCPGEAEPNACDQINMGVIPPPR